MLTMTQAAYDRFSADLDRLGRERAEMTAQVAAAGRGDEADMAQVALDREVVVRIDHKMSDLRSRLAAARIVEAPEVADEVVFGCVAEVRFDGDSVTERYLVASHGEQAEGAETVTPDSPMGAALMGAKAGDVVAYQAPFGTMSVIVVSLGRP